MSGKSAGSCVWAGRQGAGRGALCAGRGRQVRRCSHVAGRRGARRQPAAPHCRRVDAPARHFCNHSGLLFNTWKPSSAQQTDSVSQAIRVWKHRGRIYNEGLQHHRTKQNKHERTNITGFRRSDSADASLSYRETSSFYTIYILDVTSLKNSYFDPTCLIKFLN